MKGFRKPPPFSYTDGADAAVCAYWDETKQGTSYGQLNFATSEPDNTGVTFLQSPDPMSLAHLKAIDDVAWQTITGGFLGAAFGAPVPPVMIARGLAGTAIGLVNGARSTCYSCHVYGK